MRSHVKLLGMLQLAWGGMGLLLGGSLFLLAARRGGDCPDGARRSADGGIHRAAVRRLCGGAGARRMGQRLGGRACGSTARRHGPLRSRSRC